MDHRKWCLEKNKLPLKTFMLKTALIKVAVPKHYSALKKIGVKVNSPK